MTRLGFITDFAGSFPNYLHQSNKRELKHPIPPEVGQAFPSHNVRRLPGVIQHVFEVHLIVMPRHIGLRPLP